MLKRLRPELPSGCVSDLRFDALRAHELSPGEADEVEAHARSCERCQARQRALTLDSEAVSAQLLPLTPALRAQPRAHERAPGRARHAAWIGALALAAGLSLVLIPRPHDQPVTRTKGSPSVGFYVKRGSDIREGVLSEPVAPGDVLRFVVVPSGFAYLAILSRSASGETDVYFPRGTEAAAITPDAASYPLPGAVELDDTLEDERIYALFCREPFALSPLRVQLAGAGTLVAGPDCALATLDLRKRAAP